MSQMSPIRLTDEDLARLEALRAVLPAGKWSPGRPDMTSYDATTGEAFKNVYVDDPDAPIHMGQRLPLVVARAFTGRCHETAQLIAALVNALPALVAEVRAGRAASSVGAAENDLRRLRAVWRAVVDEMDAWSLELDAEVILDAAVDAGLYELLPYDPATHGDVDAEEGDIINVLTPLGRRLASIGTEAT